MPVFTNISQHGLTTAMRRLYAVAIHIDIFIIQWTYFIEFAWKDMQYAKKKKEFWIFFQLFRLNVILNRIPLEQI